MAQITDYLSGLTQFPVVSLSRFIHQQNLSGSLYACLAYGGFTSSIKSPLAYGMISLAKQSNLLAEGQPIVEASSGTFGAALTVAAVQMGHPIALCVSASVSEQRISFLKQLGAKIVVAPDCHSQQQLCEFALHFSQNNNAYFMNCFSNDLNPEFHRRITGPTILKATDGDLDFIVAGVGTGGTVTGVGEYVKAWSNISMVAVEPFESPVLSGGLSAPHSIDGIGADFLPDNYNPYVVNRIVSVSSKEAESTALQILLSEGIPACKSAGAAAQAACYLLKEKPNSKILCVFSGIQTKDV